MFLRVLPLFFAILFAPWAYASRRIIPIAGHTSGVNGSQWSTEIALANETASATSVEIRYPDFASLFVTLAPGESRRIADDGAHHWIGQVEVLAEDAVVVSALVLESGGTAAAMPVLEEASLSDRGIVPGLIATRKFRTNIALVNAGAEWTSFTLRFRGPEGELAADAPVAVAPHSTLQLPSTAFVPAVGLYGLEWSADHPASVCASVIDNFSDDPTIVPSTVPSRDLFFPVAGRVEGAFETSWSTSLLATSNEDAAGMITLELHVGEAKPRATGFPIAAHGTLQISDVCERLGVQRGMGHVVVRSTVELAAYTRVLHTAADSSTYGSLVAPRVRPQPVDALRIHGVRRDADHRLNVLIANVGSSAIDGEISLSDAETIAFHIEPQSVAQYAMTAIEVIEAGTIDVRPAVPGEIAAIASVVDNRSGDSVIR